MTDIADRLWQALCEMRESEGVILKDAFTRRVTEILAAEEASVVIESAPITDHAYAVWRSGVYEFLKKARSYEAELRARSAFK